MPPTRILYQDCKDFVHLNTIEIIKTAGAFAPAVYSSFEGLSPLVQKEPQEPSLWFGFYASAFFFLRKAMPNVIAAITIAAAVAMATTIQLTLPRPAKSNSPDSGF